MRIAPINNRRVFRNWLGATSALALVVGAGMAATPAYAACGTVTINNNNRTNTVKCEESNSTVFTVNGGGPEGLAITINNNNDGDYGIHRKADGGTAELNVENAKVYNNRAVNSNNVGIFSESRGSGPNASAEVNLTIYNRIETAGGTGVLANVVSSITGNATVNVSGEIYVVSKGKGVGEDGIEATVNGGIATIDMSDATGTIDITGGGGNGILLNSRNGENGNLVGIIGEGVTVTLANGAKENSGIRANTNGDGTIDLVTAATVITTGDKANGILATTDAGIVKVTNTGDITTEGNSSEGIQATTTLGEITITSDATITTTGTDSDGILATSVSGSITVTNTGEGIEATGVDSDGIQATTGAGAVTVTNDAAITAGDDGIEAVSGNGDVTVDNGGNITAVGDGISAMSVDGDVTVTNKADANITTTGTNDSVGIQAMALADGVVTIDNSGEIETAGTNSEGIFASTESGEIKIDSKAAITTNGSEGYGINAITNTGFITIENSGDITAQGDISGGINAYVIEGSNDGNPVKVTNSGIINTEGATDSYGIFAGTSTTGTEAARDIVINNNNGVSTLGDTSSGIAAISQTSSTASSGSITIINDGVIATEGDTSAGISAFTSTSDAGSAGDINIENKKDISTKGDGSLGILAASASSSDGLTGNVSVENSAKIDTLGEGATGIGAATMDGIAEIINSGAITTAGDRANGIWAETESGEIKIDSNAAIKTSGSDSDGILATSVSGAITVNNTGEGIEATGADSDGILAMAASGAVTVNNEAAITAGDDGIEAISGKGDVMVTNNGSPISTTGADESDGIHAIALADGVVTIDNSGEIITAGTNSEGIFALTESGEIDIKSKAAIITDGSESNGIGAITDTGFITIDNTGNILAKGDKSNGINASALEGSNDANPVKITNLGIIKTEGAIDSYGIFASTSTTGTEAARDILINNENSVSTLGDTSSGIAAISQTFSAASSGSITIINDGVVATEGDISAGIAAYTFTSGSGAAGDINIGNNEDISTKGNGSMGILAFSDSDSDGLTGNVTVDNSAKIDTEGNGASGIEAATKDGVAEIINSGAITTAGDNANGIWAETESGEIKIDSNAAIKTSGADSDGIRATTDAGDVEITNSGAVTSELANGVSAKANGSGATLTLTNNVASSIFGDTGVRIEEGFATATFNNEGEVGSWKDNAIVSNGLPGSSLTINNKSAGTITGNMTLGSEDDTVNNDGVWNIRNFSADSINSERNTKAVAISDFGAGENIFNNNEGGTVSLAAVNGGTPATDWQQKYYVPTNGQNSLQLESNYYTLEREGVVQGQMLNLDTFVNSGTIDLRGSGSVGNTLVITGSDGANNGPGNGVFISNGGTLLVNTVLNNGILPGGQSNSYSDMLIVDSTEVGPRGATVVHVTVDQNSVEAYTPGNGIEIIEVRNKAASANNAFVLNNRVVGNVYEYELHYGGIEGDDADGNWYLRSGPGREPDYRNEVMVDMVLPALASRMGLGMIGTLHDRIGEDFRNRLQPAEEIWCKDPAKNFRCTPTAEQNAVYSDQVERRMAGWARIFGESGEVDFLEDTASASFDAFHDNGPSYDYNMWGFQAGLDVLHRQGEDGSRDVAGFYLGYGRSTADVRHYLGWDAGTASMNGYSLGGYWTHFGEKNWYVDAVVQGTWYDGKADAFGRAQGEGERLNTDGWGVALSLETGYPFDLGNGWTIEPQAQLVYQYISLDNGEDAYGRIDFDKNSALHGRLGARLAKDWQTESGRQIKGWVRGDVWSSFDAKARTIFSDSEGNNPTSLNTALGGTWARVGLGLSAELTDNVSVFGSGDYNFGLSDGDFNSWSGRAGLKVKW